MNNGDLILEVGALVKQGHPYEKCVQNRVTAEYAKRLCFFSREWKPTEQPIWNDSDCEFRVAKGFVEGKPVFDGDVMYHILDGAKFTVEKWYTQKWIDVHGFTLTPPKPKVEIPEGFIEWHGGECPDPYDTKVTVIFRSGMQRTDIAHHLSWIHATTFNGRISCEDIIAYKIHKPTTFTLDGEVLPRADRVISDCVVYETDLGIPVGHEVWIYKSIDDADKVRAAFAKLTEGI